MLLAIPVFVAQYIKILKWWHTAGSEWGDMTLPTGNADVLLRLTFYFEDGESYDFAELQPLKDPFCILRMVDK
jgi:hypothetical protein